MEAKPITVTLYIERVPLSVRDHFVLAKELLRCLSEGLSGLQLAGATLSHEG